MKIKFVMIAFVVFGVFLAFDSLWPRYGFFVLLISGISIGCVAAGIIWLIGQAARRMRFRNPGTAVDIVGKIVYWIGCALAVACLGLAIYSPFAARTATYSHGVVSVVGLALFGAVLYWAIGRGIQYVLGR
jgi:hypothetical protein